MFGHREGDRKSFHSFFSEDGPVVQLVRTLACHARGRRFEPVPGRHFFAPIAQLVEQGTENPCVRGSIPRPGTSSNLVSSSKKSPEIARFQGFFFCFRHLVKSLLFWKKPFDYYLTTKVLENGSETRKEPPQNVPRIAQFRHFSHLARRQFTPVLSLVRTRSPVQIWLAAPETTVSDLLTVVFCYAATESFQGLGGGVQAKRNRAPMSYLPGVPENTEYFWGETGHQFKSG